MPTYPVHSFVCDIQLMCLYNCHFPFVLSQDVHTRYHTESHQDIVGRFNERWALSMEWGGSTRGGPFVWSGEVQREVGP